jgi:hypothetical protein
VNNFAEYLAPGVLSPSMISSPGKVQLSEVGSARSRPSDDALLGVLGLSLLKASEAIFRRVA